MSDSEVLLISRTFLSIPTGLNNHVVWMVIIRPLISKFSSSLSKHLGWGAFKARRLQLVSPSLSCPTSFLVLQQGPSSCLSLSLSLSLSLCVSLSLCIYIYIYILFFYFHFVVIITRCEISPTALADGLSLESEWQPVSPIHQDLGRS